MLTKLDRKQIISVYNEYMTADFPSDELKPLSHILKMFDDGYCTFFALMEDGKVLSYFSLCFEGAFALVDYLAVRSDVRGKGLGTETLRLLKTEAKGLCILVECEKVSAARDDCERSLRERRIGFYTRSGFKKTTVSSNLFGVDYSLLAYPQDISDLEAEAGYTAVYLKMLGAERFSRFMKINP